MTGQHRVTLPVVCFLTQAARKIWLSVPLLFVLHLSSFVDLSQAPEVLFFLLRGGLLWGRFCLLHILGSLWRHRDWTRIPGGNCLFNHTKKSFVVCAVLGRGVEVGGVCDKARTQTCDCPPQTGMLRDPPGTLSHNVAMHGSPYPYWTRLCHLNAPARTSLTASPSNALQFASQKSFFCSFFPFFPKIHFDLNTNWP